MVPLLGDRYPHHHDEDRHQPDRPPLPDPLRLAEDSTTLSLMTGGRFALGVGRDMEAGVRGLRSPDHQPPQPRRRRRDHPPVLDRSAEPFEGKPALPITPFPRRFLTCSSVPWRHRRSNVPRVSATVSSVHRTPITRSIWPRRTGRRRGMRGPDLQASGDHRRRPEREWARTPARPVPDHTSRWARVHDVPSSPIRQLIEAGLHSGDVGTAVDEITELVHRTPQTGATCTSGPGLWRDRGQRQCPTELLAEQVAPAVRERPSGAGVPPRRSARSDNRGGCGPIMSVVGPGHSPPAQ